MKRAEFDWPYVQEGLLVPGATLLVAILCLGAGMWFNGHQKARYETFSSSQDAVHSDYDELTYRRRLLESYYHRYSEFQSTGFIGTESRLDWIETIRDSARDLDLPIVSYSLEPQRRVIGPVPGSSSVADVQIFLSRIDLELGLVHELDLLRYFERVASRAPGLMKVDGCEMVRLGTLGEELLADANLSATCSINLFTVVTSDIELMADAQ